MLSQKRAPSADGKPNPHSAAVDTPLSEGSFITPGSGVFYPTVLLTLQLQFLAAAGKGAVLLALTISCVLAALNAFLDDLKLQTTFLTNIHFTHLHIVTASHGISFCFGSPSTNKGASLPYLIDYYRVQQGLPYS